MPSIPRRSRHRGALRASVALVCALCAAACADDTHRHREALTAPTAPTSATVPAPGSASGVSLGTAGGGRTAPAASAVLAVVSRPAVIAFPPRNESFLFRQELELVYRSSSGGRRRAPTWTSRATSCGRRSTCDIA